MAASTSDAHPEVTGAPSLADTVRALDPLVLDWVDLRRRMLRTPGVQVAVRVGGELLISGALGTADTERSLPLTTDHLFRIASHSKTFAATVVLRLAARGRRRRAAAGGAAPLTGCAGTRRGRPRPARDRPRLVQRARR